MTLREARKMQKAYLKMLSELEPGDIPPKPARVWRNVIRAHEEKKRTCKCCGLIKPV